MAAQTNATNRPLCQIIYVWLKLLKQRRNGGVSASGTRLLLIDLLVTGGTLVGRGQLRLTEHLRMRLNTISFRSQIELLMRNVRLGLGDPRRRIIIFKINRPYRTGCILRRPLGCNQTLRTVCCLPRSRRRCCRQRSRAFRFEIPRRRRGGF